ncbi:MAG: hypothetical protein Q8K92_13660, partial [Leadbetterella sp.]|nr:hypothetical protein [Leadbetterella sp.]
AIYGCNIRVFDFNGEFIMDVNTREIFVPVPHSDKYINIAANVKHSGAKREIVFNTCNALVIADTWKLMSGRLQTIVVKSPHEFLLSQRAAYIDNQIMYGCSIDGLDQVMVSSFGYNMLEAVYLGAKHAGSLDAFSLESADDLRPFVQDAMSTMEGSVNDSCGDSVELEILARLLQVQIYLHAIDFDQPVAISNNSEHPQVHLYSFCSHYNLLVLQNSWEKLEKNVPRESSKRHKNANLFS